MKKTTEALKRYLMNREFIISTCFSFFLFIASLILNFFTNEYAALMASNSVTDIILDNIPVYDVDGIFIYGPVVLFIFFVCLCIAKPQIIPFTFKSMALFVFIRSIFMSLTHIGLPPTHTVVDPLSFFNYISFGPDLFFSGHTGMPFLLALIFWNESGKRIIFLTSSVFFGVIVLMAHLHYSIDVLSAFFITYAIFHISELLFKKDRQVFFFGLDQR